MRSAGDVDEKLLMVLSIFSQSLSHELRQPGTGPSRLVAYTVVKAVVNASRQSSLMGKSKFRHLGAPKLLKGEMY